jgi:NAD(P) transhydrogenase subunit alpha
MAHVASDLYGTNLLHFLDEMGGAANYKIDLDNDAVRPALILEKGDKRWPPPAPKKIDAPKPAPQPLTPAVVTPAKSSPPPSVGHHLKPAPPASGMVMAAIGAVLALAFVLLRYAHTDHDASFETYRLLNHFTVFVMAVFVGFQVVWNVTPALHTPLMSVTNAISGIIVVGGLLSARGPLHDSVTVAVVATLFATINITGGFWVTRRMLGMFRK